jgi:hypothetical protein
VFGKQKMQGGSWIYTDIRYDIRILKKLDLQGRDHPRGIATTTTTTTKPVSPKQVGVG